MQAVVKVGVVTELHSQADTYHFRLSQLLEGGQMHSNNGAPAKLADQHKPRGDINFTTIFNRFATVLVHSDNNDEQQKPDNRLRKDMTMDTREPEPNRLQP